MLKGTVHINASESSGGPTSRRPALTADRPRSVGSYTPRMFEFPPELVSEAEAACIPQILVDSRSACLAEAGELIAARVAPERTTELGELFDPVSGRLREDEKATKAMADLRRAGKSLFKCVGIGGMDVAITRLVVDVAEKQGTGSIVAY